MQSKTLVKYCDHVLKLHFRRRHARKSSNDKVIQCIFYDNKKG